MANTLVAMNRISRSEKSGRYYNQAWNDDEGKDLSNDLENYILKTIKH